MEEYGFDDIVATLASRSDFTPDFHSLRHRKHILVFNYFKPFRSNREESQLLLPGKSKYLGKAYTAMDTYVMKELQKNADTKAVFRNENVPPMGFSPLFKSYVKGDLYALTPEALLNLDRAVRHTQLYTREERFIRPMEQVSPFKNGLQNSVKAWMYFGIESVWDKFSTCKSSNIKDNTTTKWMWN